MTNWADKSPDEILGDINALLNSVLSNSNGIADRLYMSVKNRRKLIRYSMTKRKFRRWRGKGKELRRSLLNQG